MPDQLPVIRGAEAFSHAGGPVGVLVSHGFTGTPSTMRPVAEALAAAGFSVELPRLPGHGTTVDDMMTTTFDDYTATVAAAYDDLAGRCERTAVVGLSMGGTMACWLAARHPEIAGMVCINPFVAPPEPDVVDLVQAMVDAGEVTSPGVASDIADPDATEIAYDVTPLPPLLSLFAGLADLQPRLGDIACPVLVMTSPDDHVVDPANSEHLAAAVRGPVERVSLARSYHVATLDHDRELVAERTVEFVRRVSVAS